jgi:N-acylneuraminate cytidylyltransferase
VVSTEDSEIAEIARRFGAEVPFIRPNELAQDSSPELHVWRHAIQTLGTQDGRMADVLVSIPTTSPFRAVEDVEACIAGLFERSADLCITVRHAHRNPYFNMVKLTDGWAGLVTTPPTPIFNRQGAPEVFDITTVAYAASASYVLRTDKLLGDKVRATIVPEDRSLDIDTELDLAFAEFLLQRKEKNNFQSV